MILKSSQIAHADSLSVKSIVHFVIELEKLFKRIGEYLLSGDETVSTAESVTAGFLQFSFSQMKDASQFFKGGMTAYTLEEKVNLLDVDALEARQYNSVSPHIAETMALQAGKLYKTDWSIGVTGYAIPVEESEGKLFAYFAIAHKGKVVLSEKLDLHSRTKPVNAQLYYSEFILGCFKLELDKNRKNKE